MGGCNEGLLRLVSISSFIPLSMPFIKRRPEGICYQVNRWIIQLCKCWSTTSNLVLKTCEKVAVNNKRAVSEQRHFPNLIQSLWSGLCGKVRTMTKTQC